MPTIEVSGRTVSYRDTGAPAGRAEAPTILFGHGLLFSGWMYDAQVDALRDRYRCVTIDWRGQGQTPAQPGCYDMDTLAEDAVGLIRSLGVGRVHWVGLSMGGFVGMRLGARHGELLRSLTLLNTSAAPEPLIMRWRERFLSTIYPLTGPIAPIRSQILDSMFGPEFRERPSSAQLIEQWFDRLRATGRRGLRGAVLGVANRQGVTDELGSITVPTQVVGGDQDKSLPVERSFDIVRGIEGARLYVLQRCGHSCTIERPAETTQLIASFLDEVDSGRFPSARSAG